ncbi:hypothetical protein YC2023_042969 [Brassica napus]
MLGKYKRVRYKLGWVICGLDWTGLFYPRLTSLDVPKQRPWGALVLQVVGSSSDYIVWISSSESSMILICGGLFGKSKFLNADFRCEGDQDGFIIENVGRKYTPPYTSRPWSSQLGSRCFALLDKPNNYYPRKEVISSVPRNFLGIS